MTLNNKSTWRINNTQYAYGYVWTGDSLDGSLGFLNDGGSDYGEPIEYEVVTYAQSEGTFKIRNFYLDCTSGQDASARAALSVSRDGVIFGTELWRDLGSFSNYANRPKWGIKANASGYMGFKLRGYGVKDFTITRLEID